MVLLMRAAAEEASVGSELPLRSCFGGVSPWKVWHALDVTVAEISVEAKDVAVVPLASMDSSVLVFGARVLSKALRASGLVEKNGTFFFDSGFFSLLFPARGLKKKVADCKGEKCILEFSPFGESCVDLSPKKSWSSPFEGPAAAPSEKSSSEVVWRTRPSAKRRLLAAAGLLVYVGADRLSEATSLHYGVGVVTGVAASFLAVVWLLLYFFGAGGRGGFFLFGGRRRDDSGLFPSGGRFRCATLLAVALGYARLLQRYVAGGLVELVSEWPV